MSEFRKWMDISSRLFEEDEVESDKKEHEHDETCDEGCDLKEASELDLDDEVDLEPLDMPYDSDEKSDELFYNEMNAELEAEGDEPMRSYDLSGEFGGPFVDDEIETGSDASEDVSDLLSNIQYYQDMGISETDRVYDIDKLTSAPVETIKRIHARVTGN